MDINKTPNGEKVLDAMESWLLWALELKDKATQAETDAIPKVAKLFLRYRPDRLNLRLSLASCGVPHK